MQKSTTNSTVAATVPSFHDGARIITDGQIALDKFGVALIALKEATFQKFIDACSVAGVTRDERGCKALQTEIKTAFEEDVMMFKFEQKTIDNYSQGVMRAFYHGKPWTARAFQSVKNGGIEALPWSRGGKAKSGGKSPSKSGAIKSTTRAELDKTLCKLLIQARLMGLGEFAADILDLAIDSLEGFKEAVEGESE